MVYHRSDSGGSSSADAAPRRHSESLRGSARDEEEHPKSRDDREDSKYSSEHSRSSSRYKDGRYFDASRSRNGKDDGKYSDSSRYSKDSRSRDGREEGKYHDRPREGRDESLRHREGKDEGRYSEGSSRYSENRYIEGPRYSSSGSRHAGTGGNGENWYSDSTRYREESRYYGGSSRYHGEDESGGYEQGDSSQYEKDEETEDSASTIAKAEREKHKNVFQNDGSFLEMFKKMQEASKSNAEPSETSMTESNAVETDTIVKQEVVPRPAAAIVPKRGGLPVGIVGKRRGGRVLPTGMVKKQKKEEEEEVTPKDAWSLYMAEVRKYKEASCEEEGKTHPLVK
ncbi:hypothetical protein C0J52_28428 [Blattella germanica]|nr:hypothetical protein C0J52_28428 [Blattella germanica]